MTTKLTITTDIEVDLPYERHCATAAEIYLEKARSELGRARVTLEVQLSHLGPLRAASVPPDQSADLLEAQMIEQQARLLLGRIEAALESLA